MAGDDTPERRPDHPHHEAQRLSTSRLFLIVIVFLALSAYAIWNSDRFQALFQGVSEQRLSELLKRPVSFRRVDFQIFPPSIHLADVRVGNDPRLPDGPLLEAEELTIGGGVSVTGGELRFGRVRAVRPKIALVQFDDGTWNLPPGLSGPSQKGGLNVRIGELVIQNGVFEYDGRRSGMDGRFDGFAVEIVARPPNRYRGTFACRRATVRLPGDEPFAFGVDFAFRMGPESGVQVEALRINGDFGELRAAGSVENLKDPTVLLRVSADLHVAEVERLFRSDLGFGGDAALEAQIAVPSSGSFRITGRLTVPKLAAGEFPIEDFTATVLARPNALVGRIEKARYAGGELSGIYRIEGLADGGRVKPMTLSLDGRGISVERFFSDIHLPGTGLSGSAAVSATLRWAEGGIAHSSGGARVAITAGPARSLVRGRFGVPVAGGGDLPIVDGRIGFEGAEFRFPVSTLALTGGLRIGQWLPDFDFRLKSRDLAELDRIFQNFEAASGGSPSPLGLGGSGEVEGRIAKSWGDPEVTARFTAENARYGGITFGSLRGAADMHDGAFLFHPLRVYEGSATISLEGTVRFRKDPKRPTFDFVLTAKDYPVSRLLKYLDLDYPIEGRLTGSFPIAGSMPEGLTGSGVAALDDAVLWGQAVPRLTGRMALAPGKFELDDVRAELGGGGLGGRIAIAYKQKTFEARAAGDGVALESLSPLSGFSKDFSGRLSFAVSGSGEFAHPDLTASATLSEASFYGHAIPEDWSPRLALRMTHGIVDGTVSVPGHVTLTAKGDVGATPIVLDVGLDAPDIAALLEFTPAALPAGDGGALAAHGRITLPSGKDELPSAQFVVTEARLDARDRKGVVRSESDFNVSLQGKRVVLGDLHAIGDGVDVRLRGAVNLSGGKPTIEARATGSADASVLGLVAPDLGLAGRFVVDLVASGPASEPAINGTVRLQGGRYRVAGYSFDDIEGSVRLLGSSGEIESLRARVGDGEAFVAGRFRLAGTRLQDFRLTAQGRRIGIRAVPALRLTIDADLVATGNESGNQLRGEITLLRGTYSRDVEVTLSDLLARSRPAGVVAIREPWKERTSLDVRIVSAAALEVRNNLARLSGSVDLRARGTLADPILVGQVRLDEGGSIVFSDIRYEIEAGTLTFSNTGQIAPFVDLRARAEVRGYNLVVLLVGTWPRIQASFTSDPPLANDAILGLLLSGTPPDTRNPTDTASQLVSAAGGAVAGAATAPLREQTKRLFRLDRFQIDPVFTGSQITTVRGTIGKQVTRDLSVTSSIALDASRDPIIRVEWQATNDIFVQLLRDENGILSISVRRRQRL
ncbi:MAG TPA: translocation/assembly module TamB domain-containing protein [Thermoanaerobaculia bacterium]|nr:translocation/assembly module TamB domain-containing protein [Thermoanaerobaculia bacterium]